MNKYKIKFQPYDKTFEIEEGRDILSFAIENGINIPSICNGEKLCGKCIIKILEGNVPPTHIETKFFSDIEIKDGLRLACKTKVRDNISVLVLNEEEVESIKILTTGLETPVTPKNEIKKIQIKFNKPSLDNLKPYSECLLQSLPEDYNNLSISFDLLKDMSSILEKDNENYFLVIKDGEILNIETQEQKIMVWLLI